MREEAGPDHDPGRDGHASGSPPFAATHVGAKGLMQVMTVVPKASSRTSAATRVAFDPPPTSGSASRCAGMHFPARGACRRASSFFHAERDNLGDDGGYPDR